MLTRLDPPLRPRQGLDLQVLAICRISTDHQDERSLADQEALYRAWLRAHTDLPFELTVIAGKGSGENLERTDYLRALEFVDSGRVDLVITEDLGRICRRVQAHLFCESCEDAGTRLIAINDHLDTTRDDWRLCSFFAVMRHETYNRDTAARIRRSQRNRFSQGGVFQFPLYGYDKPPGAKSDSEVSKDPSAEPIYREWFRMLEDGATFAEVADWLNDHGVPTGPFTRTSRWDGTMVGRVTRNTLLKGVRRRNEKMSKRVNKTGRRHSVKAPPEERLERHCPHLAFFDPVYYDRVIRIVDERNNHCRRNGKDGRDSRLGMPRKRTAWPGQHLRCGVCNRLFYWTGCAAQKCMICSGAQNYKCWNSVENNGEMIARKLMEAISAEIMAMPDFDGVLLGQLRQHWDSGRLRSSERQQEIRRQLAGIDQQVANVIAAIAEMGGNRALQDKLVQLEGDRDCLRDQSSQLERVVGEAQPLPSLETIKHKARELFVTFAPDAPEMHRLMCQLVPDLRAYPYQICDGGAVVLRARFELNLVALSDTAWPGTVPAMLRREMVVDLFEPPQRVRFRTQVTTLRAEGLTERQVAAQLGITQPAVQRAAALSRRMEHLGITDPYVLLTAPTNASGLRRHLHRRYRFDPNGDSISAT